MLNANITYGTSVHYMDMESPNKEDSQDFARESLIAISNLLPDNAVENGIQLPQSQSLSNGDGVDNAVENGVQLPQSQSLSNGNGVLVTNADVTEKYRSDLISISYVQSPDAKPLHES
ncbi:hypothetical protein SAY87_019580 [Trapa incisa]|uniref:Uncharacterized protein n=1 Tax=Trapa incisa TaxID=236973 RepID=A0AAN7K4Q0_9MYRT|nr:hypothetical protein SAY87_019580 [Trapa incisa]